MLTSLTLNIKHITDLSKFQTFISLLATRAGNILNISEISKECGVTEPTCRSWLSILESTYIIYLLKPYYNNHSKRLIKSPKLYFVDTGLLCYLLGIDNIPRLLKSSERGSIFENMIIMEFLKKSSYLTGRTNFYYYRTQNKVEVDLIIQRHNEMIPIEIKFTKTPSKSMARSVNNFLKDYNLEKGYLVSISDDKTNLYENVTAVHWSEMIRNFE